MICPKTGKECRCDEYPPLPQCGDTTTEVRHVIHFEHWVVNEETPRDRYLMMFERHWLLAKWSDALNAFCVDGQWPIDPTRWTEVCMMQPAQSTPEKEGEK